MIPDLEWALEKEKGDGCLTGGHGEDHMKKGAETGTM